MSRYTLVYLALLLIYKAHSQKESNIWYFGHFAGLDFSTNPPTSINNSAMDAYEGVASISDASGNILFYTDGTIVYNKFHVPMANGTGLMGNQSSTQAATIVKQPGNSNIYYIFTQDAIFGSAGIRYTIVDMALAAGAGSVTVKNSPMKAPCAEKVAVTRHCNGSDIWILSHGLNNNRFMSFLLSATGLDTAAVISKTGSYQSGVLGQMKISPNGRRLGMAIYNSAADTAFEIFDFNPSNGTVSNPVVLNTSALNAYGFEFSPDGTKAYGGCDKIGEYYQWDLCAGTAQAIAASEYQWVLPSESPASFQLGSQGRIYISNPGKTFLSSINNPNAAGAACGFNAISLSLLPNWCAFGLPNMLTSAFSAPVPPFTYSLSCLTGQFQPPGVLTVNQGNCAGPLGLTSVNWIFGNPALPANTSSLLAPTYVFPGIGTYTVKLALNYICGTDTAYLPVNVTALPPSVSVAGPDSVCKGTAAVYTATGASSYKWSNNSVAPTTTIFPTTSGVYTVTGTASTQCEASATFTVIVKDLPDVQVAGSFSICKGSRSTYTASGASTYTWSVGPHTSTVSLMAPSNMVYSVSGTSDSTGCTSVRVFSITAEPCVGLEVLENREVSIFPVPFSAEINIAVSRAADYVIRDVTGKEISNGRLIEGNNQLNTREYSAGIYQVEVTTTDGSRRFTALKIP